MPGLLKSSLPCYVCSSPIHPGSNEFYSLIKKGEYACENCFLRRNSNPHYLVQESKIKKFVPSFTVYDFLRYQHINQVKEEQNDPYLIKCKEIALSCVEFVLRDEDDEDEKPGFLPITPQPEVSFLNFLSIYRISATIRRIKMLILWPF